MSAHAFEGQLALERIGAHQSDLQRLTRFNPMRRDSGDHGRVRDLDACATIIDIGDDRRENLTLTTVKHHRFDEIDGGTLDTRRPAS